MIQRERERRAQAHAMLAEAARLQAEEATRLAGEQQRLQDAERARELAQLAEDRKFLEDLQIPSYLQSIIDEEHLEGAYILWSTTYHGRTSVAVAQVSLVWDIEYAPHYHRDKEYIRSSEGDYLSPEVNIQAGYNFKRIDIMGSAREKLIALETKSNRIERGSSAPSERTRTVLTDVAQNRTSLEQSIASAYLDYPKRDFPFARYKTWPFSEWVPEAEAVRDRIAREKESPILPSSPTPAQRPTFFDRLLGRS